MKKLDKNKPYGQITGCTEGRVYEQDGVYFNGDGTEWEAPEAEAMTNGDAVVETTKPAASKSQAKRVAAQKAPVKAVKPVDSQLNDQLKG